MDASDQVREERLDHVFRVLADPTRRAILERLSTDAAPLTVGELAAPYRMTLAAVSKHLKALEGAGMIERRIEGREHRFRLRGEALAGAHEWLGRYERFWTESFAALDAMLSRSAHPKGRGRSAKRKPR